MFDVYEEVSDQGQQRLGTNWVLVEKIKDGKPILKARLTIRGDLEDTEDVKTDAPTVRKANVKTLLMIAATEGWEIRSSDVQSAFLQSVPLERDVYVLPPKEKRIPGVLWKLKKPVYGLSDASRGFHLSLTGKMTDLGCVQNPHDPAMFLCFPNGTDKNAAAKKPIGLAVSHVDDLLHTGISKFSKNVMNPLREHFIFGSEEKECFRYVGLNVSQNHEYIDVDQDHYIEALEVPDLKTFRLEGSLSQIMDEEGQTDFRSIVAKILQIGYQSRPDVCFEAKALSTFYGKATLKELKEAVKKIIKLKADTTVMRYPNMGDIEDWVLVCHGDAGIKSMPDKVSSVAGHVLLIVNRVTNKCSVMNWRSKKIKRIVSSSLGGETLATIGAIGEVVYAKAVLKEIYGTRMNDIPAIVFTDSNNLFQAAHTTKLVDDPWLIPDISSIKEALKDGVIDELRLIPGDAMIANCLTKSGASGSLLLKIIRSGTYEFPGTWPSRKKMIN